jgi:hypothetical protein
MIEKHTNWHAHTTRAELVVHLNVERLFVHFADDAANLSFNKQNGHG